ncbi:RNase P protein component [Idiomarina xiamenensis 10-D-4]|uniref:Ribonuclease P protein component n=2 Tax=Idiomarina xiamenensis TaxID=1207041 RepID=K2KA14_9GAMM|nr:RNase P protein component [Idiomarina xiamenensis 10-D-4]
MLASPNQQGQARIGVVIGKKRAKRAVDRNRIKRQIRESFRLKQYKIPAFDIVIIAKSGITDLNNDELRRLLDKLWSKLSRRCEQYQSQSSASTKS